MSDGGIVGTVAVSTAGRDRGRVLVITGIVEERREDGMVFTADGRLRRQGSPKRKKLMHLRILAPGALAAELERGIGDRELARLLAPFKAAIETPREGAGTGEKERGDYSAEG